MIPRIRRWLASPFWVAGFIVMVVCTWLIGRVVPSLCKKISRGSIVHVYMPIARMYRRVAGIPTWQVVDVIAFDIQPRTDEERARALASEHLILYVCTCGKPDCRIKEPRFVPRHLVMGTKPPRERVL